jgi:hypothetical protein
LHYIVAILFIGLECCSDLIIRWVQFVAISLHTI